MYFPCLNAGKDYENELLECLGFIKHSIEHNSVNAVMLAGDLNFEWHSHNTGSQFASMADELKLKCCADICENITIYTYHQQTSGRQSLLTNNFFNARLSCNIVNYEAVERFVNFSDHSPLTCSYVFRLMFIILLIVGTHKKTYNHRGFSRSWDKGDLSAHYAKSYECSQEIQIPISDLIMTFDPAWLKT